MNVFSLSWAAAGLALLGLSLFLTIFECRGRYLLLYAPYYVIGGVLGWRNLYQRLARGRG